LIRAVVATLALALTARAPVGAQAIESPTRSGCAGLGLLDAVVVPAFDELLLADAIVHIRIAENGRTRQTLGGSFCWTVSEASADVLRFAPLTRIAPRFMLTSATILASRNDAPLVAGQEYLAFVSNGTPSSGPIVHFENARDVSQGRVRAMAGDELRLRDGMSVDRAFDSLVGTYRRYSHFRRYDNPPPRAFDTLSRGTGWLELGVVDRDRGVWPEGQPFEFAAAGHRSSWLPSPKDRIRLKQGGPVVILDFGALGEALWKRSPATRHGQLHLSDDTGARADAGAVFVVEDVQFEPAAEEKLHFVWVRLAAAP
jgi:hypothetical protein